MFDLLPIIKVVYEKFSKDQWSVPFADLGLDSFDMLSLRTALENAIGKKVADESWINFNTFLEIQEYCKALNFNEKVIKKSKGITYQQKININMPQMSVGGLSEYWLWKELGNSHWQMICDALGECSDEISDGLGNRLYATFVRTKLTSNEHFQKFRENEQIEIQGKLSRFGKSIFLSKHELHNIKKEIKVDLMTVFASRDKNNNSLLKGEPIIPVDCEVEELNATPVFYEEYKSHRKKLQKFHELMNKTFSHEVSVPIFEMTYNINPYQDINGVNLLYFAAYPAISDFCEREFINSEKRTLFSADWAFSSSIVARDVFYYGNADVSDVLLYRIHKFSLLGDGKVSVFSSLYRKKDLFRLADFYVIKEIYE